MNSGYGVSGESIGKLVKLYEGKIHCYKKQRGWNCLLSNLNSEAYEESIKEL